MKNEPSTQSEIELPSPELLFQVSRDSSQENFLRSAQGQVAALIDNLSECEIDFEKHLKLLDFGCGVGKVLIGLRKFPDLELYGCDLAENLIEWCSQHIDASCYRNELSPPLVYASNSFDVINAISVFTHLDLEMQLRWAWELYRVLKPGGFLHFTVHGSSYFGLFAHVAKTREITDLKIHTFDDSELFMELEQPIFDELYEQKQGSEAQGQLEVAVAHTEAVIKKIFAPLALEKRVIQGSIGGGHDAYIMRKNSKSSHLIESHFEIEESIHDNSKSPVSINFNLSQEQPEESRFFRIFVTADAPGIYFTEMTSKIEIKQESRSLLIQNVKLTGGTRLFGSSNWSTIDISLPREIHGDITIEISSTPSQSSYLKNLVWIAPQIIAQ